MSAPPQLDPLASTATPTRIVPGGRRARIALGVVAALLLGVLLPPYINVNRFQRRITASISQSLGRPVHLDHVTLNLLPVPGFTLDNFVVSEDPAFGAEPIIRASSVRATLRVSSLWRRPIEFSTIRFADPTSINLVHLADGRWNLDSILLQAARIETAPTAQATAGRAPRFPYIEATGARINLKLDQVKTPFSLTEGDLSLWLPSPQTWHLRIAARPARTDVPSGYPGLLRLDGTLGRARTLSEIPIDLQGEWRTAPLGEVSRILLGRDAGIRGEMTLDVAVHGTLGLNEMQTRVHVDGIRRRLVRAAASAELDRGVLRDDRAHVPLAGGGRVRDSTGGSGWAHDQGIDGGYPASGTGGVVGGPAANLRCGGRRAFADAELQHTAGADRAWGWRVGVRRGLCRSRGRRP